MQHRKWCVYKLIYNECEYLCAIVIAAALLDCRGQWVAMACCLCQN